MIKLGETQSTMDELKKDMMIIGESKAEPKVDNTKMEFKKLKDEAKKLFEVSLYLHTYPPSNLYT